MRETWKQIEGGMFDFSSFYQKVADAMPDGARMIEVPAEILETYDTDSHWGVWAFKKQGKI